MSELPVFADVQLAHSRIAQLVHRTPVLSSSGINEIAGLQVYFKCENFQKAGAFKYRGATNAILSLNAADEAKGVATHSSGNHAAALALAAARKGIRCYVVMPDTAPRPKIEAVQHYGARITFCKPTLKSREDTLKDVMAETGAVMIHPYDNFNVICGQGTAAKELLEDEPMLDVIFAPVGGGGLLSGTSLSAKSMKPSVKVFGCEPANADDAFRSFRSGILQPSLNPKTIADGLLTSLSELTFAMIRRYVDDIYTVSEESIIFAMQLIWRRMKIIVEPSSAVPLAVLLDNREAFRGMRAGILISGGNVDLQNLPFHLTGTVPLPGNGPTS
jgi:threonine dehydratase